ncbi:MAG TPA: DNA polymerase III subunit gamma/tau [Bacteroidales bacterium]|nr:DNA polymerase III subunit gamma/tau [Bacteroidales bacterium]
MENFIVSARKYRPTTFDTVIGQESITTTLNNAIRTNHLSQTYLFCGPRGVGKTTCARILAKTINCQNLTDKVEACDQCESCKSFNTSRSFNIHELDAASNNKVDDIRTLTDQVRIPPQVGKYSIYIIDEVHMLSTSAFNAFLKTLEEPPPHAIFILATTEKQKIIPTILSRCQIFDFNRITIEDIVGRLSYVADHEGVKAELEALHIIALKADGAMRDALSIFDQIVSFSGKQISYAAVIDNLNVLDYEYYLRVTDAFIRSDLSTALVLFNEILEKGFDGHNFIAGLGSHFRNLLVCKDEQTATLMEVGKTIKERYLEQTERVPAIFLYKGLEILYNCDINYRLSRNQRLHVELALVKLCDIVKPKDNKTEPEEEWIPKQARRAGESSSVKGNHNVEPKVTVKDSHIINEGESPKSFSIKDKLKPGNETVAEVEEQPSEQYVKNEPIESVELNRENLQVAWKKFGSRVESPRMASIIQGMIPVIKGDNEIELALSTDAQKEYFDKRYKGDVLDFLKTELDNTDLTFYTVVNEILENNAPYTDKEKLKHLAEKNPAIDKLKRDFKLDFE